MSPEVAIGILDRAIARDGQIITITRMTGSPVVAGAVGTMRAAVSGYQLHEIKPPVEVGDMKCILSPTALSAANWPGPLPVGSTEQDALPRRGDLVDLLDGRVMTIENVIPVGGDRTVRIELQLRG